MKTTFITGMTGQGGAYLAELIIMMVEANVERVRIGLYKVSA